MTEKTRVTAKTVNGRPFQAKGRRKTRPMMMTDDMQMAPIDARLGRLELGDTLLAAKSCCGPNRVAASSRMSLVINHPEVS